MPPVLELRSLCKQFGSQPAVDGVSLALAEGELFSLIGPSGCGKTTTLRMVAGLETATSGQILLAGREVQGLPPQQRDVSTVFQNYALFPHLSVEDNVAFGLKRRGAMPGSAIKTRVAELLRTVQLIGKQDRFPHQLSGGERQRVALARSLILHPQVLLLDEPLSALDPQLRRQVRLELKSLQKSLGTTFLLVTHDQEEALSLSDRIGVMQGGRLQQVGAPRDVYRRPLSRFVAEFLGDITWRHSIGLRPESIQITPDAPTYNAERSEPATVKDSIFLGHRWRIELQTRDGMACVADSEQLWKASASVWISWNAAEEIVVA